MSKFDQVILGINHMFLYPDSIVNGSVHTATLAELAENPAMDALDCWVWAANAKEELPILRNSGKQINYNIGDRFGETPVFPSTADKKERSYAMDTLRRETEFALECGAKKIIFASGKDVPLERNEAKKRFQDFVLEWMEHIPHDVWMTLEPTDQDVDKFFLYGDLLETCECVKQIRDAGHNNMGILLDMGHIPIMHESLESAVEKAAPYIEHIHLGNCVIKNKANPLFGDKHPCWGDVDGEYDEKDGARLLALLADAGYLTRGRPQTISFEMRPLVGMDANQTVQHLRNWFNDTMICGL